MNVWKRLCNDETGFVVSTELILVATVLVIGMLVGLVSVRDQVVQELGDIAEAISDIDQSYRYTGVIGHTAQTNGSDFTDLVDFCDAQAGQVRHPSGVISSACIIVVIESQDEK